MTNPHLISTFVLVAHAAIIIAVSLRVIMLRRPTGVALAWLAVIYSLPLLGLVLYLLFGERRLGRRRIARTAELLGTLSESRHDDFPSDETDAGIAAVGGEPLYRLIERVLGFPAHVGNDIRLLTDFGAVFDALIADIDAAQRACRLEFYIWSQGGRADDLAETVMTACRRGVDCKVSIDAVGSKAFIKAGGARRLRKAGVSVVEALPLGPVRSLFVRADLRNHRKIAVIDGRIAYTGSQNLVDPRYFKQDSGVGQWVDAMVRIEGPAVTSLAETFQVDWSLETGDEFVAPATVAGSSRATEDASVVQVVPTGPAFRPEALHQLLLTTVYLAREELVITTPYFVPDEAMLTALVSAALRGVQVTIIVPARIDSRLVRFASAATFEDLLSAGARSVKINGGLLHTKSITVDGAISVFGSVNLDMRSIWLNFEISLFVYGRGVAARLRELQDSYLARSDLLDLDTWRKRPRVHRLAENTLRLFGPLL